LNGAYFADLVRMRGPQNDGPRITRHPLITSTTKPWKIVIDKAEQNLLDPGIG